MSIRELLPSNNNAPFEVGLAEAFEDRFDVPIEAILNPNMTPDAFLPFLAAHESVRLWYNDWSNERKRFAIENSLKFAQMIGTFDGLVSYLGLVDTEVLDRLVYPRRFIFGRSRIEIDPINVLPFRGRYLLKVHLRPVPRAMVFGKSTIGKCFLSTPSLEPIERALRATVVSKSPETQYLIDFAWRKPAAFADIKTFDDWPLFGMTFTDRKKLD